MPMLGLGNGRLFSDGAVSNLLVKLSSLTEISWIINAIRCQRRSDIAAAGRSKSAAGMCKQEGPLEGAFLLAAHHS